MNPSQEILEQSPPHDADAETWVVGSAMIAPSVIDELGFLRPKDFYSEDLRTVFTAIVEMHHAGQPIDAGLLLKKFPGDEWAARFAEMLHATPTAAHAGHYARIVAKLSKWRHLQDIGENLIQQAHRAEGEPETLLDAVESELARVQ